MRFDSEYAMLEERGYFDSSDHRIDETIIELDKKAATGSLGATSDMKSSVVHGF